MDNYFILSSKLGDKWAKVAPNMKSVKLGTCIHIVWTYFILGIIHSFHDHSLTHLVFLCTFMYMFPYLYLYLVILGARLKKRVVRPMGYRRGGLSSP
jgi:hypothetical protein